MLPPTSKANVGEPPSVFKVTASLNVTVAVRVSVALRLLTVASLTLAMPPVLLLKATLPMSGAKVSMLMTGVTPALPGLPALSV